MARKRSKSAGAKKAAKRGKRSPTATEPERSVAAQLPTPSDAESESAAKRYGRSLEERGEAVPVGQPLPPGATHEIVERDADGTPVVKRKRFSAH